MKDKRSGLGRRQVITAGAGLLAAGARAQTTAPAPTTPARKPPGAVGGKFYPTGQVREWPGDTIICPVGPGTALHQALKAVQEAAMTEPVMRKFTLLPTSSLHMTLFEGVDLDHRRAPFWPAGLPLDAPLATVDQWCKDQLGGFHTGGGRFRMRPDLDFHPPQITDFSLRLVPVDPAEAARLKALRDRLSALLGIRAPSHDRYRFHITLGYLIDWLAAEETVRAQPLFEAWFAQIAVAAPVFEIGPPVFCTFRDMFAFTPVLALQD